MFAARKQRAEKADYAPWGTLPTTIEANFEVVAEAPKALTPIANVNELPAFTNQAYNGDKFFDSFGDTWLMDNLDYDILRRRSIQIFRTNPYGRGIIRRLITNEINTGLTLEATPDDTLLGLDEDQIADWSEDTERRFTVWGSLPDLCDHKQLMTFGALQQLARETALISGDCLVVLRQSRAGLPTVQIIDGVHIETPLGFRRSTMSGPSVDIRDGIEVDAAGRHLAAWVLQDDGTHKRVPMRGARSGRRVAWMIYGAERRPDDVRGEPILGILLHSLRDLDRYRDAELRSALANALIALWVEYGEQGIKTNPIAGGAQRKDSVTTLNSTGDEKTSVLSSHLPGVALENLPAGAKLKSHDTQRPNVNYGSFEAAELAVMGWALEIPPEIVALAFQNNYSASRAAQSEFKMYLDKSRAKRADEFGKPIYQEWLISMSLLGKIVAPGFLDSWRDPNDWETFGAWTLSDWAGAIKPSVDRAKEVKAYVDQVDAGFITRDRASKELNNMKFTRVARQLRKENELIAEAREPLAEAEQANSVPATPEAVAELALEELEANG
jgi:lambda family phage portal protein